MTGESPACPPKRGSRYEPPLLPRSVPGGAWRMVRVPVTASMECRRSAANLDSCYTAKFLYATQA